ncbi:hypothetical protein AAMO2058_000733500 [Amorphochlora amoebiformis]
MVPYFLTTLLVGVCAAPQGVLSRSTRVSSSRMSPLSLRHKQILVPKPVADRTRLKTKRLLAVSSVPEAATAIATNMFSTPDSTFNTLFAGLGATALAIKVGDRPKDDGGDKDDDDEDNKRRVRSLQRRFLSVFWMMRMADWLQGPYFFEVYASKVFNGAPASLEIISRLFLVGFGTTAIIGPTAGRLVDSYGRKLGTLAYSFFYTLGALSTKALTLPTLLAGRVAGGIGTSLLFSAPEAWLVGEHQRCKLPEKSLGQTFGLAYAGDSIVAIVAGQLAALAAASRGPSGPFELSTLFLASGALTAALAWKENVAEASNPGSGGEGGEKQKSGPSVREAFSMMLSDRKILLVSLIQALFEGSMYIFVLQWPPALQSAIQGSVPFGKVFSCFMASCLIGTSLFASVGRRGVKVESSTIAMLGAATVAMAGSVAGFLSPTNKLANLITAFFLFEVCVGMYFPSIGTLRSKYIPDSHRSVIMNLSGVLLVCT